MRLEQETISVFTPVVRMFLLLVALYYVVNTVGHFFSESGWSLVYFTSISTCSAVAATFCYFSLKSQNSILKLEVAGIVGNGLLLLNLLFYYSTTFDDSRLVYFILLVFIFPLTGATRRVSILSGFVALLCLYAIILIHDRSYLADYVYIGIASSFVAVGGSFMLRRIIMDALDAKLDSAQRKIDAMEAAEHATRLSVTDNLTDLPNRRDFFRTLEMRAAASQTTDKTLAVMLIDLDGFKPVNDTYGHSVGDSLLISVGQRLREELAEDAYLARIGGDEFAAIIWVSDAEAAKAAGDALCHAMRAPFNLGRIVVHVGATAGVAIKTDDSALADNLVEYADYALYNAKRNKKGSCALFTESDASVMTRLFFVDQALRRCDLEKELSVVYQPQFDMAANSVSGFEALARWNSSELGKVDPETFIGVAETSGLITEVTQVLLRKAMATFIHWPSDLTLSFNLSVHDVLDITAIDRILDIVRDTGVHPSRICFEITETVMMGDIDKASVALQKIVDAGHEVALDDFGTGYSNFSYLHKLPISKIKIDRSFIRDITDSKQSIKTISTLLQLSRSLNKDCVVEGVETATEFTAMQSLGARTIQGFYCGKPMSVDDVQILLQERDPLRELKDVERA